MNTTITPNDGRLDVPGAIDACVACPTIGDTPQVSRYDSEAGTGIRDAPVFPSEGTLRVPGGHLQSLLAAIVDSSDDAIISKDLGSFITTWNRAAERIFGYTADEAIGQPIAMLIPPECRQEEAHIYGRIAGGERIDHFETVRIRKDGSRVDVSLTISPIIDGDRGIVGASKVARDISDRKRAEMDLRDANERLSQANAVLERRVRERTASLEQSVEQLEEFSYTVSHDLRAPLRYIRQYGEMLLERFGPKLGGEGSHFLRRITENAARLETMVVDALAISRFGPGEIQLTRTSLDRVVREIVHQDEALQLGQPRIRIGLLADVRAHEPSLRHAVVNLLSNAIKYVAPDVVPTIEIFTESRGLNVRLWIRDNGIGIAPELQPRLFRIFERVHAHLPYSGNGVGLAIVKKAAQRMGGTVGVESDGVTGSRFWIELRAATEERTADASSA